MFHEESNYSVYRPAYHRIPSTIKETSPEVTTPIIVPSMSNISQDHTLAYQNYYKPITYPVLPIHHTLGNATITYGTIEHQKDLVKDVFFSPAMNDREMSPFSSTQSDDDTCSLSPSELLPLEQDLFDFGLEEILEKSEPSNTCFSKRRWSESDLKQNKRPKKDVEIKTYYFDSNEEESDEDDDVQQDDSFEKEDPLWESEQEECIKPKAKIDQDNQPDEFTHLPKALPRPTAYPTIYQKLTKARVNWCRYCGTTEGVNWRPGPWGKRTLCNKHGCDYKGYGFACKLPRLDLTGFNKETIDERERPVLQLYCSGCQRKDSWEGNVLIRCEGCPKAFHQSCCPSQLDEAWIASNKPWFCNDSCCENSQRKRIVVELPRKRLPLMCAPSKSNSMEKKNNL